MVAVLDSELAGRMHMITVDEILASYRSAAVTEREKGTYFEHLSRAFLLADPVQSEQYETT